MVTCALMSRYAFFTLGSSSANGTSIASRTRVELSVSTVLFTGVLPRADIGVILRLRLAIGGTSISATGSTVTAVASG